MTEYRDTCSDEVFTPADLPVQVCMSAAGYYIGQLEPCGAPFSRLSDCYYKKREDAETALKAGWPCRDAPENKAVLEELEKKGALTREAIH